MSEFIDKLQAFDLYIKFLNFAHGIKSNKTHGIENLLRFRYNSYGAFRPNY